MLENSINEFEVIKEIPDQEDNVSPPKEEILFTQRFEID
jgi:hypothetical protein